MSKNIKVGFIWGIVGTIWGLSSVYSLTMGASMGLMAFLSLGSLPVMPFIELVLNVPMGGTISQELPSKTVDVSVGFILFIFWFLFGFVATKYVIPKFKNKLLGYGAVGIIYVLFAAAGLLSG